MSAAQGEAASPANGLTITRPSPSRIATDKTNEVLNTIEDVDSTHTMTPTVSANRNEKSIEREQSPLSAFYNPTPTRSSLEKAKSESRQDINIIASHYDTDIEAQSLAPQKTTNTCNGKVSLLKSKSRTELERMAWPGQKQLKEKKQAMRKARGEHLICCGCMAGLDKRTKLWLKILIALIVVGIGVGVGVGVSRAVGGGVYKSKDNANVPISS